MPSHERSSIDLSFLQDRDLYHKLAVDDLPSAFAVSENKPGRDVSLSALLQGGHFRRAAESALRDLLQTSLASPETLLALFYTRLACLILISRPDLASQEALPLVELLSVSNPEAPSVLAIVPWDLRMLLARLQTIGAADGGRKGIMALYALAADARAALRRSRAEENPPECELWTTRLEGLGLRVCDALVEMGELETATRHLDTLSGMYVAEELAYRKALLRIRVGDVHGAQRCAAAVQDSGRKKGLNALIQNANGDYTAALETWQALVEEFPGHELFAHNAAVSMLYTGRIRKTREALEDIARQLPMFPALLFNLSTVYELCTERAPARKISLAEQAAAKVPTAHAGGWEKSNFEFKL